MFSDDLKEGTQRVHNNLEKKLVSIIRKVNTPDDYIGLLKLMYGYYEPLQQRIFQFVGDTSLAARTRMAGNILNDIKEIDSDHDLDINLCNDLPNLHSLAASLGALYVTEGSTLGGKIITKMIAKQVGISNDKAFSFFNAYGEETDLMWNEFKQVINAVPTAEEKAEMIASARDTFEKFNGWITQHESEHV